MAGGADAAEGGHYSPKMGSVFVFNLIVGAGALALPASFSSAGLVAGSILLAFLALFSFIGVTFMVETMAIANACIRREQQTLAVNNPNETSQLIVSSDVATSLTDPSGKHLFEIDKRVEMGFMAEMFFSKIGVKLFYTCIIIYLYGDLCIYAVAVPKSLQSVTCGQQVHNGTVVDGDCPAPFTHTSIYYLYLCIFSVVLAPWTFFNVQKTKWLQIFTTVMRWSTFTLMICIAIQGIADRKGFKSDDAPPPSVHDIKAVRVSGLPQLFGTSIYSFMCHHSLPSLVTPISDKSRLTAMFTADFVMVLAFYSLLCFTAVFRFPASELQDLYTLNFQDFKVEFVSYFLGLFPVFVLSANFPIISITLTRTLRTLFSNPLQPFSWTVDKIVFPLAAIVPPIAVAFFTENVGFLVGFTGSYAGVGIQYVAPAMLCYCARAKATTLFGGSVKAKNHHASIFRSTLWIWFLCGWAAVSVVLVTVNHILTRS
eukprot:m.258748 g.258748  ORF g.258748 m.258748 type:complete len:484 (-) comp22722_c3_seq10:154-1605(-)